jgi:hypothetical protein
MKKSKVDAIIKRKVAEARQVHDSTVARIKREERDRYELSILPPDDGSGVCIIGGQPPPYGMVFVAIYPGRHTRLMTDPGEFNPREFAAGMKRAAFRPIQMCQSFQTGQRVVWYNYQFQGIQ